MSIIYINPYRFAAAGPTDPDFANVSLLLHGDGANGSTTIIDSSPSPKTVTAVDNAQISTAQSKFGGSSISVSQLGNPGYVYVDQLPPFGTEDWTIEFWYYVTYFNNASVFLDFRTTNSQPTPFIFSDNRLLAYHINGSVRIISSTTLPLNEWFHVAVCRAAGITKQFLNGTQEGISYVDSNNYIVNPNRPTIGIVTNLDPRYSTPGYIDDLRITKGVARYTANFTPPTAPFPDA